jgi:hypothetical protein
VSGDSSSRKLPQPQRGRHRFAGVNRDSNSNSRQRPDTAVPGCWRPWLHDRAHAGAKVTSDGTKAAYAENSRAIYCVYLGRTTSGWPG